LLTDRASDGAGAAREFVGWMGLVAAIDGLVRGDAPATAPDSRRAALVAAAPAVCGPAGHCSDCPEVLKAALAGADNYEGFTSLLYSSERKG
jgi:hypothetical protein